MVSLSPHSVGNICDNIKKGYADFSRAEKDEIAILLLRMEDVLTVSGRKSVKTSIPGLSLHVASGGERKRQTQKRKCLVKRKPRKRKNYYPAEKYKRGA